MHYDNCDCDTCEKNKEKSNKILEAIRKAYKDFENSPPGDFLIFLAYGILSMLTTMHPSDRKEAFAMTINLITKELENFEKGEPNSSSMLN